MNRKTGEQLVVCSTSDGRTVWDEQLPPNTWANAIGVRSSGELAAAVVRRGAIQPFRVIEFTLQGEMANEIMLDPAERLLGICIAGDDLIVYSADQSVKTLDLATKRSWRHESILPGAQRVALHASPNGDVVALDLTNARLATLDPRAGVKTTSNVSSPEIESAKERSASEFERQRLVREKANQAHRSYPPPSLCVSCIGAEGRLHALLCPIRREDALFVSINMDGSLAGKKHLLLQPRDLQRTPPVRLSVEEDTLFAVYPDGEASVYSLDT